MVDESLKREIIDKFRDLKIEIRNIPIENVETDLIPIDNEGTDNLETIVKWEKIKRLLREVI